MDAKQHLEDYLTRARADLGAKLDRLDEYAAASEAGATHRQA